MSIHVSMTGRSNSSFRSFAAPHHGHAWLTVGWLLVLVVVINVEIAVAQQTASRALTETQAKVFERDVLPLLESYCADCHLDGADEGGVTLDALADADRTTGDRKIWDRALKQLRHDLMPPRDMDQPTAEEQTAVEDWIKSAVFEINAQDPDPGHVIVRRLNRIEYRNTIKDLLDYEVNTELLFPPDDTGHGFDNMAEVLTLSPLLMEKYINAATEVIAARVPVVSAVPNERKFAGADFEVLQNSKPRSDDSAPDEAVAKETEEAETEEAETEEAETEEAEAEPEEADEAKDGDETEAPPKENPVEAVEIDDDEVRLFYSGGGRLRINFDIDQPGKYDFSMIVKPGDDYVDGAIDLNRCRLKIVCDDETITDQEFERESGSQRNFVISKDWQQGSHWLIVDVTPLTNEQQTRRLRLVIRETRLVGPLDDPKSFVFPERHEKFFPDPVPEDNKARKQYASKLLFEYAKKAFRRPPEPETVAGLVELAESVWSVQGDDTATFEKGVAQSMVAILSSPNFIFRETFPERQPAEAGDEPAPTAAVAKSLIDEYSLASRLSYFLWSTMPDGRMIKLADEGKLRDKFDEVLDEMVKDDRFNSFYKNFVGQWLRTRDIERVTIDAFAVLRNGDVEQEKQERELRAVADRLRLIRDELTEDQRAELKSAYRQLKELHSEAKKFALNLKLRQSMKLESEMLFEHIVKMDSDLIQLIDCDFTFLNERLARHYGIEGVEGHEMRLVKLEPETHRGGILTHGSFLAVTSNPDRTSPVKRGVFVLDNLLGMPAGSPPPDIPALEASSGEDLTKFTLRKALAKHREDPLCSSCHNRMDPLGLALENFDALGRYRTEEGETEIDASGELISGESFENIDDLRKILASGHKEKFYRCVTEKMMTYALGRSVDYYDLQTIDDIVAALLKEGGKPSVLLRGIVRSPAFQMTRIGSAPR